MSMVIKMRHNGISKFNVKGAGGKLLRHVHILECVIYVFYQLIIKLVFSFHCKQQLPLISDDFAINSDTRNVKGIIDIRRF